MMSGAEDAQLAEGILEVSAVDIRGWIVLRASQGRHALFQYHPGQDTIVGSEYKILTKQHTRQIQRRNTQTNSFV